MSDKQCLFCLMRQKVLWSYFVSSCRLHSCLKSSHYKFKLQNTWQVWNAWPTQLSITSNLSVGKLLVPLCIRCIKNRLSHNFKPQHVESPCIVSVTWPLQPFVFHQRQNNHDIYFASWGKIDTVFLIWVTWKFSEC